MNRELQNKKQDKTFFIVVQILISVLMILFTLTLQPSLTSAMFALSFITLLLLYFSTFRGGKINSACWPLLIWSFVSILLSYFGGNKSFVLSDLVSYITFVAAVLFMQIATYIEVTKKMAHMILFLGMASAVLYPIGFYLLHANVYRGAFLTMNFSNPNLTGVYLAQACLYSILGFFLQKRKTVKIIAVAVFALDMYLLYLTDARNALLAVVLALGAMIWAILGRVKHLNKGMILFIAVFPFLFAVLYLLFIEAIDSSGRLDFIVSEAKTLDSRVKIWERVFKNLKGIHWIIGDFTKIRGNMHNTHLTILGSYGLIGLWMMIKYLNDIMNEVNRRIRSSTQAMCMICFFGTIFMGNGEAALFYGGMGIYAIACSYLILARYDWAHDGKTTPMPVEEM